MKNQPKAKVRLSVSPLDWWSAGMSLPQSTKPDADDYLSTVKSIGYSGTALGDGSILPIDPLKLNKLLQTHNLVLSEGFWPTELVTKPYDEQVAAFGATLAILKKMNCTNLLIADFSYSKTTSLTTPITKSPPIPLTPEQRKGLWTHLTQFVKIADDSGVTLSYHPHMGTIIQSENEIDQLMANVAGMKLAADTGHLALAGIELLPFLKKYQSCIVHYHLKNVNPAAHQRVNAEKLSWIWAKLGGVFTAPGDGGLDFAAILKFIVESNYSGWVTMEIGSSPFMTIPYTCSKLSYDYVTQITQW